LVGVIIGLQIEVMSFIGGRLAKYLTNFENHEKNSIYEENYLKKLLLFEFVNNFNSMFYIAFIKVINFNKIRDFSWDVSLIIVFLN